ncbi:hypothetical protein KKE34_02825 [Patescibacteria group bacterium]|nr:hypothetical protein [Patescibacteria group bacterium]MBU1885523.1 hypothetical protein [Patescibacteria group bacterium]
MSKKIAKKTIAIFTTSEGHKSIAEAIEESLQDNYQIKVFFEDIPFSKAYVALYQFFPSLGHIPAKALNTNKNTNSLRKIAQLKYQKKINKFFAKHQPDILINTYGIFNSCLEQLQNLTKIPLINIISDPKNPYPLVISPKAKANLTFDKKNNQFCKQYYSQAKYQSIGWFVRKRFEESYDQKKVRTKLNLDPKMLTFLIASGSEGTNLIMKVLPTLMFPSQPVQIIVACGNNKTLFKSVNILQSFLDKNGKHNTITPLKFTPDIHLYMQAADLVIGKAGPNMLFETVATETPFFAITHISGQEDGNLEIIKDYNLGYVEENILRAQKLLKKIIEHLEILKGFENDILKMKTYNQQSKEKLLKIIAKLI